MPTKTTKKASKDVRATKVSGSKVNSTAKKSVVKRRKLDLTPTRASAVAIASQANRAKKKALIDKLSSEDKVIMNNSKSSTKIPSWVWVFFGCSLLLFCISFYQAIIRPQLEQELSNANYDNGLYWVDGKSSASLAENRGENVDGNNYDVGADSGTDGGFVVSVPKNAVETIEEFFARLSAYEFDSAFDLFTPSLQRSSEIREHFTSFRMNPFVSGIEEGSLIPSNFQYISTSTYGKDRYGFNLSYILSSSQEKYDEQWEFVVDTSGDEPKISSIKCTTSKCSYHPIFWPENFGMMR